MPVETYTHAGSHLASSATTSEVAQLYFFVNRAEADKWMLRTCELRALVSATSASHHLALHSCYSWLAQLLAALRPLAASSSSANSNQDSNSKLSSKSKGSTTNNTATANSADFNTGTTTTAAAVSSAAVNTTVPGEVANKESTQAPPKRIRILKPQGPPEASKPRSVVKVQYSRDRGSLDQKRSSSGCEAQAYTADTSGGAHGGSEAPDGSRHALQDKQKGFVVNDTTATGT